MTREQAKELFPIIQAFAEGKTIQDWINDTWKDKEYTSFGELSQSPIKPEQKYKIMTREKAKELLPIIQALAEGKTIQYRVSPSFPRPNNRDISYVKEWFDIDEDKCDGFSCDGTIDYRIKPEPKYRPFKTKKECWNEMMKHQPFGWLTSKKSDNNVFIGYVGELNNVYISFTAAESEGYSAEMLFDNYKFVDGTPFGMCDD